MADTWNFEPSQVTVKVVPDVSGIEPAVRAEVDRIGAMIGGISRKELHRALHDTWHETGGDFGDMADQLIEWFLIIKRREESDADEP